MSKPSPEEERREDTFFGRLLGGGGRRNDGGGDGDGGSTPREEIHTYRMVGRVGSDVQEIHVQTLLSREDFKTLLSAYINQL